MPDTYELFDHEGYHQSSLPLNPIQNETTFVRFAPIQVNAEGKLRAGVLPRDVVCPSIMASLRQQAERHYYKINLDDLRGGRPLGRQWEKWRTARRKDFYRQVIIADAAAFLNNPQVTIDGKPVALTLTPEHVRGLITQQAATVFVELNSQPYAVQLVLENNPRQDTAVKLTSVQIEDVYSFLSKPEIKLGEGLVGKALLTPTNISELTRKGTTQVKTRLGSTDQVLTVTTKGSASPGYEIQPADVGAYQLSEQDGESASGYYMEAKQAEPFQGVRPDDLSIAMDDHTSSFVLPNFEFVLYLPYRQCWNLLGYSRGELIQSVALAPQQETTVEIVTPRDSTSGQGPALVARQIAAGQSWRMDPDGDVLVPVKPVTMQNQKEMDFGDQLSDLNSSTLQLIKDSTQKTSAWLKSAFKSRVVEARQAGSQDRATRKLHNPNAFQSLTVDFFEVLTAYSVQTEMLRDQARLCVLTPNFLPAQIDRSFLLCYEGVLRDVLLSPVYSPGFEAAHTLAAYERLNDLKPAVQAQPPKSAESQPQGTPPAGTQPPGQSPAQKAGASPETNPATTATTAYGAAVVNAVKALVAASPTAFIQLANDIPRFIRSQVPDFLGGMGQAEKRQYEEECSAARTGFHRWLFRKCFLEVMGGGLWNTLLEFRTSTLTYPACQALLTAITPSFIADLANISMMIVTLQSKAVAIMGTLLKSQCANMLPLIQNIGFDDAGLRPALINLRAEMGAGASEAQQTQAGMLIPADTAPASSSSAGAGASGSTVNSTALGNPSAAGAGGGGSTVNSTALGNPSAAGAGASGSSVSSTALGNPSAAGGGGGGTGGGGSSSPSAYGQPVVRTDGQNPTIGVPTATPPAASQNTGAEYSWKELAVAQVTEGALLAHIQGNQAHYRQAIWSRMDANDRLVYLSLLGNLSDYIENEVVGFVGNKAAMPFRLPADPGLAEWFHGIMREGREFGVDTEAYRVTLPTTSLHVDTRLDPKITCDATTRRLRELELEEKINRVKLLNQQVEQASSETRRLELRLSQNPPLLDNPAPGADSGAIRVIVDESGKPQ
jgi:hypothetical protein